MSDIEKYNGSTEGNLPEGQDSKQPEMPNGYSFEREGSVFYIVNPDGQRVSNGYHSFEVFNEGEHRALVGQLGAIGRILKIPENKDDFFEESQAEFHDLHFQQDVQRLISKTGAMNYIIDPMTGQEISDGYHEFFMKDGKLYGRKGATVEEVVPKKEIEGQKGIDAPNREGIEDRKE